MWQARSLPAVDVAEGPQAGQDGKEDVKMEGMVGRGLPECAILLWEGQDKQSAWGNGQRGRGQDGKESAREQGTGGVVVATTEGWGARSQQRWG